MIWGLTTRVKKCIFHKCSVNNTIKLWFHLKGESPMAFNKTEEAIRVLDKLQVNANNRLEVGIAENNYIEYIKKKLRENPDIR